VGGLVGGEGLRRLIGKSADFFFLSVKDVTNDTFFRKLICSAICDLLITTFKYEFYWLTIR
jgi:hypothetical protein